MGAWGVFLRDGWAYVPHLLLPDALVCAFRAALRGGLSAARKSLVCMEADERVRKLLRDVREEFARLEALGAKGGGSGLDAGERALCKISLNDLAQRDECLRCMQL